MKKLELTTLELTVLKNTFYQMSGTVNSAPECLGTPGKDEDEEDLDDLENAFWALNAKIEAL